MMNETLVMGEVHKRVCDDEQLAPLVWVSDPFIHLGVCLVKLSHS